VRILAIALAGLFIGMLSAPVLAQVISPQVNEKGTSGAPVSAQACSGGTTQILNGSPSASSWSIMPEGADIRCTRGTWANGAPATAGALDPWVPTATVGFLFKSNVLVTNPNSSSTARVDCCGVAGAVSVDTWHEY
jgi:hypothetical protein